MILLILMSIIASIITTTVVANKIIKEAMEDIKKATVETIKEHKQMS